MITLYALLLLMLISALALLAIPFFKNKMLTSYLVFCILFAGFSFTLYFHFGQNPGLKQWLTQGKQHYQLQEEFIKLGGTDAVIERIQNKLKTNPNDAEGWFILGKLYLSKQDKKKALHALTKAHHLQPENEVITRYYEEMK